MNKVAETIKEQLVWLSEGFNVDEQGIIQSPGRFEGSHILALYYDDCVQSGGGDEYFDSADIEYDVFIVTDSEREAFDLSSDDYAVIYYQDNSGFIYCPIVTREDYDRFLADLEAENA